MPEMSSAERKLTMAAQTQDAWYSFIENCLKAASIAANRSTNLPANAAGVTAAYGGTAESFSTVTGAITTFLTNLG